MNSRRIARKCEIMYANESVKTLALLSGGLDSTLAVKMVLDMGFEVEAVHFTTPFCNCDKCSVDLAGERFGVKVHYIALGEEFLNLLMEPPHGYGSQMNICIDCRITMLKRAKILAEKIGAGFLVTGEVLNERPFSQRRTAMALIEREAGLEGRILRPLSGALLPETEPERRGLIIREGLGSIRGRRRTPQMRLAEELDIGDYPCPSGGCLLTDPQFARKLKDVLAHEGELDMQNTSLLRFGRHFRVGASKIIVGRNEVENNVLSTMAKKWGMPSMSVSGHMGPTTLLAYAVTEETINFGASLTLRYSDAPRNVPVKVLYVRDGEESTLTMTMDDETYERIRAEFQPIS